MHTYNTALAVMRLLALGRKKYVKIVCKHNIYFLYLVYTNVCL